MEKEYEARIAGLCQEFAAPELFRNLYGLDPENAWLRDMLTRWVASTFPGKDAFGGACVNRHLFELFFQRLRLIPAKLGAARLGMAEESLFAVMTTLKKRWPFASEVTDILPLGEIESIYRFFPEISGMIFSNHSVFCTRLHAEIKKSLNIEVVPVHCVTSEALKESPPDFAYEYDCITDRPIGLRYQVWLDTKKPFSLRPDACSMLFYKNNATALKPILFGDRLPELPPALT